MSGQHDTVAGELLEAARVMVERSSTDTRGLWPRAAVVLARQSLEVALKTFWAAKALGAQDCSTRAQLLCLGVYAGDEGLARRASQLWSALSRAAHVHPYELSPTRGELLTWIEGVGEVVEKTERQWLRT